MLNKNIQTVSEDEKLTNFEQISEFQVIEDNSSILPQSYAELAAEEWRRVATKSGEHSQHNSIVITLLKSRMESEYR
jgi:hypothetical protein